MLPYLCIIYLHIRFTTLVGSPSLAYQLREFLHWMAFISSLEGSSYFTLESNSLGVFFPLNTCAGGLVYLNLLYLMFCFTSIFSWISLLQNWYRMYYIYIEEELLQIKTSCSEFLMYSPNPNHWKTTCTKCLSPQDRRLQKKYTPKHKVWSLGQKIQPTKNQLAIIHPINLFLPKFSWISCCWNFCFPNCWIFVFSPSFPRCFPLKFLLFIPCRTWEPLDVRFADSSTETKRSRSSGWRCLNFSSSRQHTRKLT